MIFLESLLSSPERQEEKIPLVERKKEGGYRITDFPLSVESPNASLHINADGSVGTAHNKEEVERIFSQLEKSKRS